MYDLLLLYKAREGHINVPKKHKEKGKNLGAWLIGQRNLAKYGKLEPEQRQRLEEAGMIWDIYLWRWKKKYDLLLKYKAREGNCNVPMDHQEEGEYLGQWLNNQRRPERLAKLSKECREELEMVGALADFQQETWTAKWNYAYSLLLSFKQREGHCSVPQLHQEDGYKLGIWLAFQRRSFKIGTLDDKRRVQLERAGVSFDPYSQKWDATYSLLLAFKEREGHCNVPQDHEEQGVNIGLWLSLQRRALKLGKLEMGRKERLEQAGVTFDPFQERWESMYALLLQNKPRYGSCNVPSTCVIDGVYLGRWLFLQRNLYRNGRLSKEREARLTEAGITWEPGRGK